MKYGRVIVPLDGSGLSECALPLACALAVKTTGELLLFRVAGPGAASAVAVSSPVLAGPERGSERSMTAPGDPQTPVVGGRHDGVAEARRYLDDVAARLASDGLQISVETAAGNPSEEVLRLAERRHAGLIVMATHGRSGLVRSVLGSVTDRVALHSNVPVMVVRPSCAPGTHPADIGIVVRTVLVPLDQSELSESALPHAVGAADAFHARLKLVTIVPPDTGHSRADAAMQYLTGLAARTGLPEDRVSTAIVEGDAKTEIPARLRLLPDAMVVMTTRGASGLTRWIRGSVTDAVIRAGLAPTMVVPPVAPVLGPAIH